jgi:hypothetical protein
MNTTTKRAIALVSVLGLFGAGMGCELLVDFDRSLIDAGISDASFNTDAPVSEGGPDVLPQPDSPMDSPVDTGVDTGAGDTGIETGTEAGSDADAGSDTSTDSGDAADACNDADAEC